MAYCEMCGAELGDGAKFCEMCGAPTKLSTAPSADQPVAQPVTQPFAQPAAQPQPYASTPLQETSTDQPQSYQPPIAQPQPFAQPQQYQPPVAQSQPFAQPQPSQPAAQGMAHQLPGSDIVVDENGAYRWVYEYSLWRDPTVFMTIFKVFGGVALGIIVFSMVIDLISGDWDYVDLVDRLRFDAIILGVSLGLAVLGYAIFALISGGSYCVMFTMDETSVENRPLAKELKRAEAIGALNVLLGLATRNVSQVGIGMLAAGGNVMVSDFANVRSIQGYPRRGVIKVNEPLAKNQVYVEKEDYDWVYAFIRDHCPRAKER